MPLPELRSIVPVDKKDVPWLDTLESRGRTSHVHWDGCEVQRLFYVDNYWAAPHVCAALLGFVLQAGGVYKRYLPAFDPIYNQILYCNEARWDHVDGDKKSISNAVSIQGAAGRVPVTAAYEHFMTQVNTVGENAVRISDLGEVTAGVPGGAFITASYRPMISAYHGNDYSSRPAGPPIPWRERQFDFMDPVFTSGVETIPWPKGFQLVKRGWLLGDTNPDNVSAELANPLTIPLIEFTIRRLFLGRVPYDILSELANTVNESRWPADTPGLWPWTIPQFAAETLRFDGYTERRHWSQSSNHNLWHEVELHFSWRNYRDYPVMDINGDRIGRTWVTWNRVFANPIDADLGWYLVRRNTDLTTFGGIGARPLYSQSDFNALFAPVTP